MILELKTEMKREDIDQRLQNFFESKGYEIVYKDEKHRICRTSLFGNCLFEVHTDDHDFKIAAWTEPSIIKINTEKKRLEKDVLALKQLFADAGGLTEAENELKGPEYHVVTSKAASILGIVLLCLILIVGILEMGILIWIY